MQHLASMCFSLFLNLRYSFSLRGATLFEIEQRIKLFNTLFSVIRFFFSLQYITSSAAQHWCWQMTCRVWRCSVATIWILGYSAHLSSVSALLPPFCWLAGTNMSIIHHKHEQLESPVPSCYKIMRWPSFSSSGPEEDRNDKCKKVGGINGYINKSGMEFPIFEKKKKKKLN